VKNAVSTNGLIRDINLLGEEDLTQIKKWNAEMPEPVKCSLHSAFQATAAEVPENTAIQFLDTKINYRVLNNLANGLARQLLEQGLQQPYVPICFEKSIEMVVAVIAVLKANKGFIPIDPRHPKDQINHMLDATASSLVLVSPSCNAIFDGSRQTYTVTAEALSAMDENLTRPLDLETSHTQPAYALFTSGSTGTPKGVVVEHQNITTALVHLGRRFDLNTDTKMFQYTSYTFDPSILEIFGTLLCGGCVCIPSEEERLNHICQAVSRMDVNTAIFVPSVLKTLRPEEIPKVKKIIIGGENLPSYLVKSWKDRNLINAYGPTETCIASVANLQVTDASFGNNIGRPIACRAWIVNPQNPSRLLAIGCVGELVIEGPTVARGYLNATKNPEAPSMSPSFELSVADSGQKVYRTGDLVRYLPDGRLQYIGRTNQQVKYHGQWLELGAIETVLRHCGAMNDCVALVTEIKSFTSLVAFVVLLSTPNDPLCELVNVNPKVKAHLDSIWGRLYEKMSPPTMPKYVVPVTSLPRQTTGKVDVAYLTRLLETTDCDHYLCRSVELEDNHIKPTKHDIIMRQLWGSVLSRDDTRIKTIDNFLHLGGNSIRAMELVGAAYRAGLHLNVQTILRHPILRDMAIAQVLLMKDKKGSSTFPNPTVVDNSILNKSTQTCRAMKSYEATPIQALCLTMGHLFPEGNYTRLIYQADGTVYLAQLEKACKLLVERTEILRTEFSIFTDPQRILGIPADISDPQILYFDALSSAEAHWKDFKTSYLDQSMGEFCFVVSEKNQVSHFSLGLHHSQFDAWSMRLLLQQLRDLYDGGLPDPGPSFSEFAQHLSLASTGHISESFWRGKLDGSRPTVIGSGSPISDLPDGCCRKNIDISLLCGEFTFAVILYASWALSLYRLSGDPEATFFSLVGGRNLAFDGSADVIGPCLNVVPTRVNLETCVIYRDVLEAVQTWMLDCIPYENLPMNEIINRCTSWDPTAIIGSMIQHLDINIESEETERLMGPWRMLRTERQFGQCIGVDVYLTSMSQPDGSVELDMKYNASRINSEVANDLFGNLVSNINKILTNPNQSSRM
jgi:amino acid adenylation domain-containing protein